MPEPASKTEMLTSLKAEATRLGLALLEENSEGLKAEIVSILFKWMLGQRKMTYKMSVKLSEADHTVAFREVVKESSWGLVPPTLTVETTSTKGWERSGTHSEKSTAGSGKVDYGQLREALKQAIAAKGWQFNLEGGRMP
jgi:hypothetical protein